MTQTLTIDIPADQWQSSNQRLHHMERARRTKHVRTLAGILGRKHLTPEPGPVHVMAFIGSPTNRKADVGNSYPTVKACVDGALTDAGILPDDSDAYLVGPDMRRDPPTKTRGLYRVRLVITPQTHDF